MVERVDAGPYASLPRASGSPSQSEMMVTLAAAVTERVRLVFNVLVLPLHSAPS
jgi:alkanesulfonate monooxygenase SsuD/methylene tetrahydromethanopterin reductase-like flavin-dependent oxidoreductase (luciferase family)